MKIENHVLNILQLYEYAMAIGKSLDYKESCDLFLKLVLKRKNLNAAWILEPAQSKLKSTYAVPAGVEINSDLNDELTTLFKEVKTSKIFETNALISSISPFSIKGGFTAIFNLKEQGYLLLYSKKDNLSQKDISQLQPVIDKFSVSLKACKAFKQQQVLLHNLEVQNQELSDYAHMVSHDLKSPLRSIDTLTTWLKDDYEDQIDETGKKQINTIRDSVEKMDTLINGILEYSTIGKNRIEAYPVELNLLVKDILNMTETPNHISIKVNDLPVVNGDKYRLQQLFQNLITNAIAYNDKKEGLVEIGVTEKDNEWEFFVKDNGKGIEEVYHMKIFKAFEKLENNVNSTGIGLSIVKKIVDLYGGKIWLQSQLHEGTTFYFTIKK